MHRLNRVVASVAWVVLFATPSFAQIAFVKTIGTIAANNNGTIMAVSVPAPGVAGGNSIIVAIATNPSSGVVACSDTQQNNYVVDQDVTNGSGKKGVRTTVLSAHGITALASGDTISCTHPRAQARAMSANEFSGLASTSTLDAVASAAGSGTSPSSGDTSTTTEALELLIGGIGVEGPSTELFTAGAGYTTIGRDGTTGGNPINNITINPEYRIVSATGAYAVTGILSISREWAAAIVTYKAAPPVATNLVITSINGGSNPAAGVNFPVVVQSQTASGTPANVVNATDVSLSLNTGAGTLGGTLTGTIAAGSNQITVSGVTYTKAESGVVITVTRTGGDVLTSGDSAAFAVDPGSATTLAFTTQPGNSTAGAAIPGPTTAVVQDSFGNTVSSSTVAISVAIGTNPSGGTLSGTTTKNASAGVATFTDLSIDRSGSNYTLTVSATGLTAANSSAFSISAGAASNLVFTAQPTSATAGSVISGPPTVAVQDGFGNTITSSTASITLAIGTNPAGGSLSGTTTKNAVSGIASFNDLSINLAGIGYTLTASAAGLTGVTSNSFNISAVAGVSLTASPNAVAAGNPFTVTWAQIPDPTSRDWIGLYTPGSSNTSYIDYRYVSCTYSPIAPMTSGTCSFPIPTSIVPGPYEFRLLPNDNYLSIATSNPIIVGPPTSQNMLTVTVAPPVTAGTPGFSLTVRAQTPSGTPVNVVNDTAVSIGLAAGSGVLGGTLNGTILAGTNEAVIGPATYSKAESGVVVSAHRTSGDDLTAGTSLPITVSPGLAAALVFTTQPGSTTTGSPIPGPPTVTIEDNAGNPVNSPTTSITIAIGTNPSGGTLSGNINVTTGASVSFSSLSIDQPGNGYTITASSPGLASATSNPFDIAVAGGGGIIAGVITRVSDGTTISGALVEAYQGITLRGTTVSDGSGSYSIAGLAAGSYTVGASFTGLVRQMVSNVDVVDGSTTPVDLSLNAGIAIQSPIAGDTVSDFSVLVTGFFDTSLAPEMGIQVNGYVALIDGDEFSTVVPIDSQTTTITATLTDTAGNLLASDTVPITPVVPTSEPVLSFQPSPRLALVSEPVGFSLISLSEISQVELDGNGDGIIDFTGASLDGITVTFASSGLYYPNVRVTDTSSTVHTATGMVQILDINQLDFLLRSKWDAMKNALRNGDTATAASHLVIAKQGFYQNMFDNLTVSYSAIDQYLPNLTFVDQWHNAVEYEITRTEGSDQVSYMVLFTIDDDGVWRIKFF